jgi:cation transport regulator ChaB
MPNNMTSDYYFKSVISKLFNPGNKIQVSKDFHKQMFQINELLTNDYTGIVKTIFEFMVATASVPMNFVTDNTNLSLVLNDWATKKLNAGISKDIPRGLNAVTTQYMRERYKSSFIVLNIIWEKIDDLILPGKMWFSDGSVVTVDGSQDDLTKKKYFINDLELRDGKLKDKKETTVLIRKPFNSWYDDYPTPYLVGKGVMYNALLKKSLIQSQAGVVEEMIPYILALRAGDASLMAKNAMGDIEKQLSGVKESLKQAKRNQKYQADSGDMILKGRYDLKVEHLIPDLTKLFNETVIKPVNNDLLCGLGLVELQGFSSDRQEAILNPKVLVEEVFNGVLGAKELYDEVKELIIEKNSSLHPKNMGKDIRIVPGVVKAFLTDNMRKLIKDHVNTGILSIEDAFEALPQGFDFEISKKRRTQEEKNGDEDLFFPRVILNQDSNTLPDTSRSPTPNEVPKKKKVIKTEEESLEDEEGGEYLEAPYTKENYPAQLKNLPVGARNLWIRVFNTVLSETNDENKARQAAWHVVKEKYHKVGDKWVKNQATEEIENE